MVIGRLTASMTRSVARLMARTTNGSRRPRLNSHRPSRPARIASTTSPATTHSVRDTGCESASGMASSSTAPATARRAPRRPRSTRTTTSAPIRTGTRECRGRVAKRAAGCGCARRARCATNCGVATAEPGSGTDHTGWSRPSESITQRRADDRDPLALLLRRQRDARRPSSAARAATSPCPDRPHVGVGVGAHDEQCARRARSPRRWRAAAGQPEHRRPAVSADRIAADAAAASAPTSPAAGPARRYTAGQARRLLGDRRTRVPFGVTANDSAFAGPDG